MESNKLASKEKLGHWIEKVNIEEVIRNWVKRRRWRARWVRDLVEEVVGWVEELVEV